MKADDSNVLTHIPGAHIIKFVHYVIDDVCGGVPVSHENYKECPLDKFWCAVQSVKDLARNVTVGKTSKEEVLSYLQSFPKETAEEVYNAVLSRKEDVKEALVRESLNDVHHLKDFDWNVKLAVASDKILDLNEAFVTLHLHTSSSGVENDVSNVTVEMSAAQVDKLLEQLKEAQHYLSVLQPH